MRDDKKLFTRLIRDEAGATAIEYGLIIALIAVVLVPALESTRYQIWRTFMVVSGAFEKP